MNYILYIEERGEKILNKRFISFILAIIILSTALPMPSFAKGQVMEIDALFGDLKLYLEDKPIPHKDVFIYDGELWIPVEDLAKALEQLDSEEEENVSAEDFGFDDGEIPEL